MQTDPFTPPPPGRQWKLLTVLVFPGKKPENISRELRYNPFENSPEAPLKKRGSPCGAKIINMNRIRKVIEEGIRAGVFPGAVVLVAFKGRLLYLEAFGNRILVPHAAPMGRETIFDLASLTKVLATTPAVMKLVDEGRLGLDQSLGELISSEDLGEKKNLTPRLLLTHSSGLPDHRPYYRDLAGHPLDLRKKVLREWIVREPYVYEPGRSAIYSDLGFMFLEWIIETRTGMSLKDFVEETFYRPLGLKATFFRTGNSPFSPSDKGEREKPQDEKDLETGDLQFAATEYCPWRKRVLLGEVDDENAFALGGYSGHAGLFSTAEEVWTLVNMLRAHFFGSRSDFFKPATVQEFFRRQDLVKGSDWALGWDTRAHEGSSAGRFFSRDSVGHTGFTGTSIWMDLVKDVTAIFLTNRVHPSRNNTDAFKAFRPKIHDAIMEDVKSGVVE
jgi:CubicO group peptidase (beta-lactamase class C family)